MSSHSKKHLDRTDSRLSHVGNGVFVAGKAVGVASLAAVAINSWAYFKHERQNSRRFRNPIDETKEVLAAFDVHKDVDDGGFFFGLATAPAHVEDELNDAWLEFAKETVPPSTKPAPWFPPFGTLEEVDEETLAQHQEKEENNGNEGKQKEKEEEKGNEEGKGLSANGTTKVAPVPNLVGKEISEADNSPLLGRSLSRRSRRTTDNPAVAMAGAYQPIKTLRPARNLWSKVTGFVGKQDSEEEEKEKRREKEKEKEEEEKDNDDFQPNVASFHNVAHPEIRLKFWTDPLVEIQLAKEANQSVYRLGIDWGRIIPTEPISDDINEYVDWAAVKHYRWILELVRQNDMEIMLSLFHHSLPKWAALYGGWKSDKTVKYFLQFARLAAEQYGDIIRYWVTFNEPHIFTMLTYCAGAWPGENPTMFETATSVLPLGEFDRVMTFMAESHNGAYDIIHEEAKKRGKGTKVGISHHVSWLRPFGLFDTLVSSVTMGMTRFAFVDDVCQKCEFIGVNYYGQEILSGPGLKLVKNEEYSDSGRGVLPDGLYRSLLMFHDRYNKQKKLGVKFIITENGISDATDYIRRPYLLEHLLAVRAAMNQGVPVEGYLHWTTSDNWEWADGYGPKFGLVHVDRLNGLKRTKRPSFYLYAEVAKTGLVTATQRDKAWNELQEAAAAGKKRPFFREVQSNGLMYSGGLESPIYRPLVNRDWRFGHYESDGLQGIIPKSARFITWLITLQFLRKKSKPAPAKAKPNHQQLQKRLPTGQSKVKELDEQLQPAIA